MTNILIIHQSAELYGSDRTLLLLLSHIDRSRFLAVVVVPYVGPLNAELEKIGIRVVVAPVAKLYRNMFSVKNFGRFASEISRATKQLDALNKEYKFDLVYSNTLAVTLGMIYAKRRKIKHLWHVHEIIVHPKPIAFLFPRLLNAFADIVVCNSNATMANLTSRVAALSQKCTVIHNGLEPLSTTAFDPLKRSDLGFAESDIVVTLAGRISRLKGHKLLLDAFSILGANNIKLLFVGTPVFGQEFYLDQITQIIASINIGQSVKIIPFQPDLRAVWAITDIAVMPSTEAESFGLVALEAMRAGLPVIGSDLGGLQEIIVSDETGFLVRPCDAESLAEAIAELAKNPQLRTMFGQNGQKVAREKFSIDAYTAKFEAVLAKK